MLYRLITNLVNATIYLLTIAEAQAMAEGSRQMDKVEEFYDLIDEANAKADKAAEEAGRCLNLRKKLEALSE